MRGITWRVGLGGTVGFRFLWQARYPVPLELSIEI